MDHIVFSELETKVREKFQEDILTKKKLRFAAEGLCAACNKVVGREPTLVKLEPVGFEHNKYCFTLNFSFYVGQSHLSLEIGFNATLESAGVVFVAENTNDWCTVDEASQRLPEGFLAATSFVEKALRRAVEAFVSADLASSSVD